MPHLLAAASEVGSSILVNAVSAIALTGAVRLYHRLKGRTQ